MKVSMWRWCYWFWLSLLFYFFSGTQTTKVLRTSNDSAVDTLVGLMVGHIREDTMTVDRAASSSGILASKSSSSSSHRQLPYERLRMSMKNSRVRSEATTSRWFFKNPFPTTTSATDTRMSRIHHPNQGGRDDAPTTSAMTSQKRRSAVVDVVWYQVRLGLAGGIAGAVATTFLFPVDAAKTLRQSEPTKYDSVWGALKELIVTKTGTTSTTTPHAATGGSQSTTIAVRGGLGGFSNVRGSVTARHASSSIRRVPSLDWHVRRAYRGVLPAALGAIPSSALYFGAYESCKTILWRLQTRQEQQSRYRKGKMRKGGGGAGGGSDDDDRQTLGGTSFLSRLRIHATAAAAGNCLSSAIFVPKELIKQQMQYTGHSFLPTVKNVISTAGVVGLFSGYKATLLRNIPSAAIRFALYEEFKGPGRRLDPNGGYSDVGRSFRSVLAGGVAGAVASGIMTPADVVKTRVATGTCPVDVPGCVRHVMATDGWTALYAGVGSRMLFSAAFSAVGFGAFEIAKQRLGVSDATTKAVEAVAAAEAQRRKESEEYHRPWKRLKRVLSQSRGNVQSGHDFCWYPRPLWWERPRCERSRFC